MKKLSIEELQELWKKENCVTNTSVNAISIAFFCSAIDDLRKEIEKLKASVEGFITPWRD